MLFAHDFIDRFLLCMEQTQESLPRPSETKYILFTLILGQPGHFNVLLLRLETEFYLALKSNFCTYCGPTRLLIDQYQHVTTVYKAKERIGCFHAGVPCSIKIFFILITVVEESDQSAFSSFRHNHYKLSNIINAGPRINHASELCTGYVSKDQHQLLNNNPPTVPSLLNSMNNLIIFSLF